MKENFHNENIHIVEKVVLVGVLIKGQDEAKLKEYLDELAFLAETAGAETVKRFTQKLEHPDPKTFVGKGKLEEILEYIQEHEVGMVIFDDELSPSQLRNIEAVLECKVLDRSNLILDIFASRAQTANARTQVELAQCQYMLPRLTRLWTHLDRQKGGGVGMRGPGETQIETDKRIILQKITLLKEKLKKIDKQKSAQRKQRVEMVKVALVGYTNVGKSTIMNMLSKSDVFAENKLFATLDTTIRKVVIGNLPFLLTDTVGFIRKLPHHLVEAFKSTLDEVKDADILVHVVDVSHPNFEDHVKVVHDTLQELEAMDKPIIIVFNKIDAFTYVKKDEDDLLPKTRENYSLEELKKMWMYKDEYPTIYISAVKKINIEEFKDLLYKNIKALHLKIYPNQLLY
ncbi:MAG: GTPase HflX [Flavobacteriales bacterium CG_4_10_14_0_2_um_filter_32_8]|nr:MAG: GTPase HflX [Flavobacteriales bacterium CG_4_10_14_0_2_um_filter_32_8]